MILRNVASFTWTPTSGTTGDFSITWDGPTYGGTENISYSGFTFDSAEGYFGFGTGRSPGRFDNISITGTVIPEPASAMLLAVLGLVGLNMRRSRRQ